LFWPYQAKTASCIATELVTTTGARYRPKRLLRSPCERQVAIQAASRTRVALRDRQVWARRDVRPPIPDGAPKRVNEWPSTRTAAQPPIDGSHERRTHTPTLPGSDPVCRRASSALHLQGARSGAARGQPGTIDRLRDDGEIEAINVRGTVKVLVSSLEAHIERQLDQAEARRISRQATRAEPRRRWTRPAGEAFPIQALDQARAAKAAKG